MVQVNFNTTPRYNTVIFLTFVTGKMMLMSNLWSDRASDKETILKIAFLQVLQPGDHGEPCFNILPFKGGKSQLSSEEV